MTKKKLAEVLEFLFKYSKFVDIRSFRINKEDDIYELLNPGQPRYFTNLNDLANILFDMLKEKKCL